MPTNISWPPIGGATFPIPAAGEVGWPSLSNFLIALADAQGTESQKIAVRTATTSPVTVVSASDCVVRTELSVPGAVTVNLPAGVDGQYFIIVDGTGDASSNNITINPNGAETINGAASLVIDSDNSAYVIAFSGTNWTVIGSFTTAFTGTVARSDIAAGSPDYVLINDNTGLMSEEQYLSQVRGGFGENVAAYTGVVKANAGDFSASTIVNADIDAGAAIDATKIADGSVSNAEFQYLGNVTSDIQAQLNARVVGPATATDSAVALYDGASGELIKDSVVLIDADGDASGFKTISARDDTDLTGASNPMLRLENRNDTATSHPHIEFRRARNGNANLANGDDIGGLDFHPRHGGSSQSAALIDAIYTGDGTTRAADIVIYTSNSGAPAERVRIKAAGDLNITNLTASRAVVTDADKDLSSSATTATQIGYLSGTTGTTGTNALVLGTAPTLSTPLIDDAADFEEIATPSNPAAGRMKLYPKSDGFFYTLDDSGTETQIGSGSGSGTGAINIIDNPSAVSNTTGWTAATDYTVTRLTSNSPLAGVIDTAFSISTTTISTESSTSGVYAAAQSMPLALRNSKNQVSFYVTTPSTSGVVWKVSVYNAGGTRMSLSSDSSGSTALPSGFTGQFVATFDADNTAQYTISFTQTAGAGGNAIIVTNIYIGNGITAQGAAISDWQSYTPTWAGGSPVVGNGSLAGFWKRDGSDMLIAIALDTGSSTTYGSGSWSFSIPSGYTIDSSVIPSASFEVVGTAAALVTSSANSYDGKVYVATSTTLYILKEDGSAAADFSSTVPATWTAATANQRLRISARVPIAEWSGNGTVNLGQGAQVEFAATSGTWDAASSTTVYGSGGQIMGGTLTDTRLKTITWQYPVQSSDVIVVETSNDGVIWQPANGSQIGASNTGVFNSLSSDGTVISGVFVRKGSAANQTIVSFGRYANFANDDAPANNWVSDAYWRVRKSTASAPVGFGLADSNGQAGLVNPYTVGSGVVYAGRYTPTATASTNVSAATPYSANYMRVGNTVTVSGQCDITCTTASNTESIFYLTLPIASNLGSVRDLSGVFTRYAPTGTQHATGTIFADTTNDRAQIIFSCNVTSIQGTSFTFQYQII